MTVNYYYLASVAGDAREFSEHFEVFWLAAELVAAAVVLGAAGSVAVQTMLNLKREKR